MNNKNRAKNSIGVLLWLILIVAIFAIPFLPHKINKTLELNILTQSESNTALMFFGFQACGDKCPTALMALSNLVDSFENKQLAPEIVFIDIEGASNSLSADKYAKAFHPSFRGVHVSNQQLQQFTAQFGLNIKQQNGQISHLGNIYFLRREQNKWRLMHVIPTNKYSSKLLLNYINQSI